MTTPDLFEVTLPPGNPHIALAHAQHKRLCYPWSDWGRRLCYADLSSSGAALIDAWADPAFVTPHSGEIGLWLRAEVWLHPDGAAYRMLLSAGGIVVVPPQECCPRPHDLPEGILLPIIMMPPALLSHVEVTP